MNDIYDESSKINEVNIREFSEQYEFDEISSINVIPQSINTWPITAYEFKKFQKLIHTSSSIKISVEWALTHHDGVKISRGKNTVMMETYVHSIFTECLKALIKSSNTVPGSCKQVVIPNLIPKFLILHLKSTETLVKSELMIHNPCKSIIFI
ncbi:uncharacterized protein LOC111027132 [Myzus persicae]|uniref:uncharacterized protein LOC111027132 n=1 Tax=Myzus persicae TaxID=13164 RepID=UPI000B938FE2|nr:uncharacterized protein LOC111027132 [Myzus persicae]